MNDTRVSDFVQVIENVLAEDDCAEIIEEFNKDDNFQWAQTVIDDGRSVVNYEHRMVKELLITDPDVWMLNSGRIRLIRAVKSAAQKAVANYNQLIHERGYVRMTPSIAHDEGFKLLKYREGYKFNEHFDEITDSGRVLTCSIALNDGFTGGEFTFFDGKSVFNPPVGSAIVFPSSFMFPHAVTPIVSGERYSIITWLH